MVRKLIVNIILMFPVILYGQGNFLFNQHGGFGGLYSVETIVNAYKTEIPNTTTYNVEPYFYVQYYQSKGIKVHPDADGSEIMVSSYTSPVVVYDFNRWIWNTTQYPSYNTKYETRIDSNYFKFMMTNPILNFRDKYRSIRGVGANNVNVSAIINSSEVTNSDVNGKYVVVGIIADNYFELYLNSVKVAYSSGNDLDAFKYTHIFKVYVNDGNNVFTFYQYDSGLEKVLGIVIWDDTLDEVITGGSIKKQLDWDVIWSTEDIIGTVIYDCPEGYVTDTENQICWKIDNISNYIHSTDQVYLSFFGLPTNISSSTYYRIEFGDGNFDNGISFPGSFIHDYTNTGTYTITLTITASDGKSYVSTKTITI